MNSTMDRSEHLQWCKHRALIYLDQGHLKAAFTSMINDLRKHPGTARHPAIMLGMRLQLNGLLETDKQMRDFIVGFN